MKLFNRSSPSRNVFGEAPVWRIVFWVLLLVELILLPILSLDAGISADEVRHDDQARKVYSYFASGGKDKAALTGNGVEPMQYNTQSFDLVMVVLEKIIHPDDPYRMRHVCNALTGWLLIFFASLFVSRMTGYRAASLTAFLLFASPFLLGHSFNNNKDIPLAAGFQAATYFMMAFFRDSPRYRLRNAAWITLSIAASISMRVGSIILVAYFFLFAGIYYLLTTPRPKWLDPQSLRKAGVLMGIGLIILPVSYFLGILLWPFGLEGPIKNTQEVLKAMSSLGISITQIFQGETIWSNQIPWYYSIKYMAITIPAVVFVGVVLLIAFSRRVINRGNGLSLFILAFAWLFPIVYAALKIKNDYGSWRHLLFTYPYVVCLAAIGFDALLRRIPAQMPRRLVGAAILLLCYHPVSHIVRNHPNEYVYYNELFGGVDKANGYYETDYYQHSIRGACEWLEHYLADELAAGRKFIVGRSDGMVPYYLRHWTNQITVVATQGYYNRGRFDWDYGIFYAGYLSPYQLQHGLWPPAGTIHSIKVDNTPVCAIVKRPSKEDFLGYEALNRSDLDAAIEHFKAYLVVDPKDAEIHGALASAYLAKGNLDQALHHADESLRFNPDSPSAMDTKGRVQLQRKEYDAAIQTFTAMAKKTGNYFLPYYFMAVAHINQGNADAAIAMGNQAIMRNPNFAPAYELVASIYASKGDTQTARAYAAEAQKINSAPH